MLDCNYLFDNKSKYNNFHKKRIRCDLCEYSCPYDKEPQYLKCTKHKNTICRPDDSCKSGKLKDKK